VEGAQHDRLGSQVAGDRRGSMDCLRRRKREQDEVRFAGRPGRLVDQAIDGAALVGLLCRLGARVVYVTQNLMRRSFLTRRRHTVDFPPPDGEEITTGNALGLNTLFPFYRRLGRRKNCDRHPEGGTGNIAESFPVAELNAGGISAMLSADSDLKILFDLSAAFNGYAYKLADAGLIYRLKRIGGQYAFIQIIGHERRRIIAGKTESHLRQVVGPE